MQLRKKGLKAGVRNSQKPVITSKRLLLLASAGIIIPAMMLTIMNLTKQEEAMAAASGDYRTIASGSWSTAAIWQKYQGSSWSAALTAPTGSDGVITIQPGHTVDIIAPVTIDQVVVNAGGQISLAPTGSIILANGAGTDISVSGILKNAGNISINAGAIITFSAASKYQHNFTTTAGTIPTASWNSASVCEIIGYTNCVIPPTGLSQTFGNFTWNCPLQAQDMNLNGLLTNVAGDLNIVSTGTKELRLSSANSTINISGNFIQSGGLFALTDAGSAVVNFNLSGNWNHTGGTFNSKSGSTSCVFFSKAGSQTFTETGTIGADVNFTINNGTTLVMGSNIMRGNNFTLSAGGGLSIGDDNGIIATAMSGNIQVSGTRSYNTGANYIYNGTAPQITGDGLPATVNGLQINNSDGLTLSAGVQISNTLTLTNGCITAAAGKEIVVHNTSSSAVTGHSAVSYIKGSLKRMVSSSGTYDFPIGTSNKYERASITLNGTTGVSSLTVSFIKAYPLVPSLPLNNVVVNGLAVDKVLDYGYWTITPDNPLTGGTYSVTLQETGHTQPMAGRSYSVLKRNDVSVEWESVGIHDYSTQSDIGGVVTAVRSGLTSFSDFCIAYGEYLTFRDPILISGVDGQLNAIYKFPDICTDVDAWVQILELDNASLADIDHFTDGYDEAWQPFIATAANDTSSIRWRMTYKVGGTNIDTIMPYLAITAVDVDGNGTKLREFVEATRIYSYALDPATDLVVTRSGGGYRATSTVQNVANIDTAHHEAMVQMNYRNVNTFTYRTGAISTSTSGDVRQNCLYFKFFLNGNVALPVNLLYFNAEPVNNKVELKWATASEKNNDFFTIERSTDGYAFEEIIRMPGSGNSSVAITYSSNDKNPVNGVSYYRLKQTDYNGDYTYSNSVMVKFDNSKTKAAVEIRTVSPSFFTDHFTVIYTAKEAGPVDFMLTSVSGQVVSKKSFNMNEGINYFDWNDEKQISSGIYFVTLISGKDKAVMKVVKQ
jgi:hypothetical protein